ncbi:uncharacterized protein EV154DRAFT_556542 [Mucor mucedo]|uniref:uncharacterized protein n=1 Tax=Mucor mucedo TaxID=29922 RepID=UPI0022200480|nr:uncharacterized protein EV154DRAFT_556542 [Mucor mucedo]KAI7871955.1 hypothetical protein EV154DRAFT_556542 [Mucor mucedo]
MAVIGLNREFICNAGNPMYGGGPLKVFSLNCNIRAIKSSRSRSGRRQLRFGAYRIHKRKKKCEVLYAPSNPLSSFPPILVEVQNKVDEKFLTRAIQYCTLTFERYNRLPIIVIFGIANATASLMRKTEDSDFPFARQIQSIGWAERCLLLTSSILQVNQQEEILHPLQAVGHFLCSQSLSINTLDYGNNDSLMKLLYAIAQRNLDQIIGEETEKLEAVKNICDISETQLQKVKKNAWNKKIKFQTKEH